MSSMPISVKSIESQACVGHLAKIVPVLCAALLGGVLLYGAGFAQTPSIHGAAHDSRHAANFPCH